MGISTVLDFFRIFSELTPEDLWTIATGAVCSVSLALIGTYLMYRRLSLLGDAISHAVLPGIALSFIIFGSRDIPYMIGGATTLGILTAVVTQALIRSTGIASDTALGVVFTTLFAIGVILITWTARDVDLDPGCVLYGAIEFTALDTIEIAGREMPRAFFSHSLLLIGITLFITLFYKELLITTFDPVFATLSGFKSSTVHYAIIVIVALASVLSFESVGSILVVSMLITPAATASLFSRRLSVILCLAVIQALLATVLGYALALTLNSSVAGSMSLVSGMLFLFAVVVAPQSGFLAQLLRAVRTKLRIRADDILGLLFRIEEAQEQAATRQQPTFKPGWSSPLNRGMRLLLLRKGYVQQSQDGIFTLTDKGRARATTLVRSHRLWETYLLRFLGLPSDHLHEPSDVAEHYISGELRAQLDEELNTDVDPHGKPIPNTAASGGESE